jgi:hypothetical protein
MASNIDPTVPIYGQAPGPTTESVRTNFQIAKNEIEALQDGKLALAGGTMTGPIVFSPDQVIDGGTW